MEVAKEAPLVDGLASKAAKKLAEKSAKGAALADLAAGTSVGDLQAAKDARNEVSRNE